MKLTTAQLNTLATMKILDLECYTFCMAHLSPLQENSFLKGICLPSHRNELMAHILSKYFPIRRRYRGPRYKSFHNTIKVNAACMSIYIRD